MPTTQTYTWWLENFADEHHPKNEAMIEPLLLKFRGRCSASYIHTALGKHYNCLPRLEKYPNGVCWLHEIALPDVPMKTNTCLQEGTLQKVTSLMPMQTSGWCYAARGHWDGDQCLPESPKTSLRNSKIEIPSCRLNIEIPLREVSTHEWIF